MPESLKNILLVMANGGLLVPPSENPKYAKLWEDTWRRLERFLPGMFSELFPPSSDVAPAITLSPTAEVQQDTLK